MIKFPMRHHLQMHTLQSDRGVRESDTMEAPPSSLNKLPEENGHMLKLIHYLNGIEADAIIPAIEKPPSSFESLESTFQFGLKSEQTVTKAISDLIDMAEKEKDRSTYSFLQWFVTEQIEEETLFHTILQKFGLLGKDKLAIYQIDQSLASVRSRVMNKQTGLK